ncbi:MAG: DUF1156 domain-containing protein [Proteobacteria bacterium]|nr:DUF1156 domain-containing protein [Pseudomonadota bacterium]
MPVQTQPAAQQRLPLRVHESAYVVIRPGAGPRAIEDNSFPFETLSDIAEVESWRKEINRPIYHIHKWWAQRLGTVFRAITIASLAPTGSDIMDLFHQPVRVKDAIVFDPFMGSGTTIGEALKLGAGAIGRDINPVAHFLVRNAISRHDWHSASKTFAVIERDVAAKLRRFYKTILPDGTDAEVLYYFWVKTVDCPACSNSVDLFSSCVFAQHAYRKRYPESQCVCPDCGDVNRVRYDATRATCTCCRHTFNPQDGPARGQKATCPTCQETFPIAKTIRETGQPPGHRLYAKLVLRPDGAKQYLATTSADDALYQKAERALKRRKNPFPIVAIEPGYNTNQALGYNYTHWHQMFNARQLLGLSILSERIAAISDPIQRDLFTCLLSGTLEFNNMFASFKGEGTGAVRHMFAHHILKPERTPLEANLWGTPKSSGSFSTMFHGRIRRAIEYAADPFELQIKEKKNGKNAGGKVYGLSEPISVDVAERFSAFVPGKNAYLSCGDSSSTDLAAGCVDVVITDPPFFDNVHYSQLADFFHVWQRHTLGSHGSRAIHTTRSIDEVQNADVEAFTDRLSAVWSEVHRVLRNDGLLVFSYHHSRPEGWRSVLQALGRAGFGITATHPIKSEMSVAVPKHQAKEPIDLDVIIVCRKLSQLKRRRWNGDLWGVVAPSAGDQIERLRRSERRLSRNDVRVIVMAQVLRQLSIDPTSAASLALLDASASEVEDLIERLHAGGDGR